MTLLTLHISCSFAVRGSVVGGDGSSEGDKIEIGETTMMIHVNDSANGAWWSNEHSLCIKDREIENVTGNNDPVGVDQALSLGTRSHLLVAVEAEVVDVEQQPLAVWLSEMLASSQNENTDRSLPSHPLFTSRSVSWLSLLGPGVASPHNSR